METRAPQRVPVNIEDEMRESYMDYAMSVIIARALPDARDGLKPVHRRILYAMFNEGLLHNRRYTKCAGVVGEVLEVPPARRLAPSTTRSSAWRRTGTCATRWSTARATSARSTATRRRPTATPSAGSRSSPRSCSPTSTRRPSTSSRTSTTPPPSRSSCRAASRTCSSTARPASPSAWRPTSRRTTWARCATR